MIVVDASVAVKWLLPEPGSTAAQHLLMSEETLSGPSLIRIEVAAALARKARRMEITAQDAEAAGKLWFQSILDGVISLILDEEDLPRALTLSIGLNHPLQDCLYLALAERLGARLVTADHKFVASVSAAHPFVRLLGAELR
jgi:predicted nucleic acid-binding protein